MQRVNPGGLGKEDFCKSGQRSVEGVERYLEGVGRGVRHIHSLGFVHNDVNPSNVMIAEDDRAWLLILTPAYRWDRRWG